MTASYTLRTLLSRWRRLALSAITVAFGVAIVTGALVFTDTTHAAYERLFDGADAGAQLIVSARQPAGTGAASGSDAAQTPVAPAIPLALAQRIDRLTEVRLAAGQVIAPATIIGADGHPLSSDPQTLAYSLLPDPFSGTRYRSGGPPTSSDQVVVDARSAAHQHWHVGERVTVVTGQPAQSFTISGIASLGTTGGERFVIFTLPEAQHLYQTDLLSQIDIAAEPGVALAALARTIRALLPAGLVLQRQTTQVQAAVSRVSSAFSTLDDGLAGFGVVAVLIGALVIFNTFSITATQRQRELALLRALGATRGQILRASLLEALITGLIGSVIGVVVGPFVALAVRAVFSGVGVGVGSGQLSVSARAIGIGLGVGIGVSLLASVLPALAARRAAPVEALRASEGAGRRSGAVIPGLVRLGVSAGCEAGGLILTLSASGDLHRRLALCGIGGGLMLLGALVAGPLVVAATAQFTALRRGDPILALARDQAMTNRGRTALSASSLMIGIALALVVSVYVSGLRHATSTAIHDTVIGDIVVESQNASAPIPASSVRAIAAVPDLGEVSSLKTVTGRLPGAGAVQINGVDPTSWPEVYRFSWVAGNAGTLAGLGAGQVLVEADTARAAHVHVGSTLALTGPSGQRLALTVAGIYRDSGLLRGVVMALSAFSVDFAQPQLQDVFVKLTGTVSRATALATLRRALAAYPGVVVRDQDQLARRLAANVADVADLLYALLVLAVAMSLLGIGGSLNLGVQTRAGELGMLRALGMTPGQARTLVRDEGALTAVVGGICGVALGLVLSLAVIHALSVEGFAFVFPGWALLGCLAAVVVAGSLAAVLPARRAGRLPVLAAITHE